MAFMSVDKNPCFPLKIFETLSFFLSSYAHWNGPWDLSLFSGSFVAQIWVITLTRRVTWMGTGCEYRLLVANHLALFLGWTSVSSFWDPDIPWCGPRSIALFSPAWLDPPFRAAYPCFFEHLACFGLNKVPFPFIIQPSPPANSLM